MMLKAVFDGTILASNVFTVVGPGVQSPLQYRIGGGSWANLPDPLGVVTGTTVEFKALPQPSGASWPPDKPVWTGASGSGDQASQTFSTLSANATDYKLVTAECGNTVTGRVIVVQVVIDNSTGVTYDGLNSGSLMCKIDPDAITPSSYAWAAKWPEPAYNNPQVSFQCPAEQSTTILNAWWYATTNDPHTKDAAFYNIYCTVQINGAVYSNSVPASFCVDVYRPQGGWCDPPSLGDIVGYNYVETNGCYVVTGVNVWPKVNALLHNKYTANSQFYPKVQAHEQKHKDDYDNGFDGHVFCQADEFAPMIIGLTNAALGGLDTMVGTIFTLYHTAEDIEMNSVLSTLEDRAYAVSDAIQPFYVYQK
jgi:hypothetical protein